MSTSSPHRSARYYRITYSRTSQQYLCLRPDANLEDFPGDAIITSTNRRLEGVKRKNWWGFSGRKSADAALHTKYLGRDGESRLAKHCREIVVQKGMQKQHEALLPFGEVLLTKTEDVGGVGGGFVGRSSSSSSFRGGLDNKGALYQNILHLTVPNHPEMERDTRPIPQEYAGDFVETSEIAESMLSRGLGRGLEELSSLRGVRKIETVCMPAIGCGCRGFPVKKTADLILDCILNESKRLMSIPGVAPVVAPGATGSSPANMSSIPYIEVRFWETGTYLKFVERVDERTVGSQEKFTLEKTDENVVSEDLWSGLTLSEYTRNKREEELRRKRESEERDRDWTGGGECTIT